MKVGDSQMMKLKVNTENTQESFTWSSSDESIATVSESGLVTAVNSGKVTIKVVSNDSGKLEKTFDITITKDEIMIDDKVYGSLSEALAAAKEGDTIVLPAGNYNNEVKITINNLTIVGPNKGINPGSGINNDRGEISKKTLGLDVIVVGIPTVVDIKTIIKNTTNKNINIKENLIVTPTNIDYIIERLGVLLATSINKTLHKNYSRQIKTTK